MIFIDMILLQHLIPESRRWDVKKLQIIKNIPSHLYHATFEENVNSIIKNGLIKSRSPNFEDSDARFVYLTDSKREAQDLLQDLYNKTSVVHPTSRIGRFSGKINVLTISTSGLNEKFFLDPYEWALGMKSYMYNGDIPSKNIIDYGD